VLVCARGADAGHELARALRARGVACALAPEATAQITGAPDHAAGAEPEAYAVRWDYTHLLVSKGGRGELKRLGTRSALALDGKTVAEIAHVVAAHLGVLEES
jgi:hypothetical protein